MSSTSGSTSSSNISRVPLGLSVIQKKTPGESTLGRPPKPMRIASPGTISPEGLSHKAWAKSRSTTSTISSRTCPTPSKTSIRRSPSSSITSASASRLTSPSSTRPSSLSSLTTNRSYTSKASSETSSASSASSTSSALKSPANAPRDTNYAQSKREELDKEREEYDQLQPISEEEEVRTADGGPRQRHRKHHEKRDTGTEVTGKVSVQVKLKKDKDYLCGFKLVAEEVVEEVRITNKVHREKRSVPTIK